MSIADIQIGYQAKTRIKDIPSGTHCIIQSRDFNSSRLLNTENLVSFYPERKTDPYTVRKGDVLFQARGTAHFAFCVEKEIENTLAAGTFYIIRINRDDTLPEYLAWWLNQPPAQSYFQATASGLGISFISKRSLSRLNINLPPLSIQEKVVKIIELWKREQVLLNRLSVCRTQLVNALCVRAACEPSLSIQK